MKMERFRYSCAKRLLKLEVINTGDKLQFNQTKKKSREML